MYPPVVGENATLIVQVLFAASVATHDPPAVVPPAPAREKGDPLKVNVPPPRGVAQP